MLVDKIKLEPDEKIIAQKRQHWFVIHGQIVFMAVVALLPPIIVTTVISFVNANTTTPVNVGDFLGIIIFAYFMIILIIWTAIFHIWTNYYLDLLTITDRRIILVDHRGFFWRYIGSVRLERMQDINVEINGVLATLLDYGTLTVETASDAADEFVVHYIPDPSGVKGLILEAADNRMQRGYGDGIN